jgi:hypothetical protein
VLCAGVPRCPRFTGDLAILVRPTLDNADRLLTALEAFGVPVTELTLETIVYRRRMLQMEVPPGQLHVMSSISDVDWDEVWSERVEGPLAATKCRSWAATRFCVTSGRLVGPGISPTSMTSNRVATGQNTLARKASMVASRMRC